MAFIIAQKVVDFKDVSALKQLSKASPFLVEIIDFLEKWNDATSTLAVSTSGSTGPPKMIHLSKVAMITSAEMTARFFGFKSREKAVLGLSANYIAGKMMLVRAMISDLDIYLVKPSSNPLAGIEALIDFIPMTPHQLMTTWNTNPKALSRVKTILLGGGPINLSHEDIVNQLSGQVYHGFGMTETITHIAVRSLTDNSSCYIPLKGISISKGDQDQLVIDGEHLEDTVITNDLVEIYPDQSFRWLGRLDNVINSGGVKLFPELIESKLKPHMDDSAFFIHKESDPRLGERVVLVIESDGNSRFDSLESTIARVLDKYERPKEIYAMKPFVLTKTGKINRNATFENK